MVTYQATNSEHNEDINTAPIIGFSKEIPSTQEPLYTTIEESTDSNSNLTETTIDAQGYYRNVGMDTMKTNEAYDTTKQPQMAQLTYDYIVNPLAVSHDPPTILLNQAYGTNKESVIATDASNLSGTGEVEMIRNEAYVGVRQLSSDNDPSILTTENEAYTSVTANTELEDDYVVRT